jgi:hypothetical protein
MDCRLQVCVDGGGLALCGRGHRSLLQARCLLVLAYAPASIPATDGRQQRSASMSRSGNVWDNAATGELLLVAEDRAHRAEVKQTCSTTSSTIQTAALDDRLFESYAVREHDWISLTGCHSNGCRPDQSRRSLKLERREWRDQRQFRHVRKVSSMPSKLTRPCISMVRRAGDPTKPPEHQPVCKHLGNEIEIVLWMDNAPEQRGHEDREPRITGRAVPTTK